MDFRRRNFIVFVTEMSHYVFHLYIFPNSVDGDGFVNVLAS